jgi:hypothetical protein
MIEFADLFDSWDELRNAEPEWVLIAFVRGYSTVLVQDDAVQAAEALGEEDGVVFCGVGCYWMFPSGHRAWYFKRLESMGKRIKYIETQATVTDIKRSGKPEPVRAGKIRLPEFATVVEPGGRKVDKPTGRVYIGYASMGTFWWCPSTMMVYMRRNDNIWIGQFCTKSQWSGRAFNLKEQLAIPA